MIRFLLGMVGVSAAISFGIHAAFSAEETAALATFPIEGKWTDICRADSTDAPFAYQIELEFQGGRFKIHSRSYLSKDCKSTQIGYSMQEGTFFMGGPVSETPGAYALDIAQSKISMTWFGAGVEMANGSKLCEMDGWKDGEARDVAGTSCDVMGPQHSFYSVVRMTEAGELQFAGDSAGHDGLTPERRQTAIEENVRLQRVP